MKTDNRIRSSAIVLAKLTFVATLFVLARTVHAQDLPYSSGSTGADGAFSLAQAFSPARYGHGMAFDTVRGEMVLFGGFNGSAPLGDTWTWRGTNWVLQQPLNRPAARFGFGMVYDSTRQQIVLFGGGTQVGTATNDTWTWDGTNWNAVAVSNPPPALTYFATCYDTVRRETVVFGGYRNGDAAGSEETWVWNGTNWTQRTPSSKPSGRRYVTMAFDEARGVGVLFGGYLGPFGPDSGGNDTWLWDGTNWTQAMTLTVPGKRWGHAMAYDAVRHEVLLHGSDVGSPGNETWAWDGTNWSRRAYRLVATSYSAMAYDSTKQRVVCTGGILGVQFSPLIADISLWDGINWLENGPRNYHFDARGRPNGVWNFTTIEIPQVAIHFVKNAANTPVHWLASGTVTINGTLYLNGENGGSGGISTEAPKGGPGGYAGGLGGMPSFQGSSPAGHAGQGPGGGQQDPNDNRNGLNGSYAAVYGNAFLQPLLGGSGGGGGAAQNGGVPGHSGGGGGGAIEIASSRDMVINGFGSIQANGGSGVNGSPKSGSGSGGGIRLQADRIIMSGGSSLTAVPDGRIWLGAYERQMGGFVSPANVPNTVLGVPVGTLFPDSLAGALAITNVAGQFIFQPPGGNSLTPDVIFTQSGPISVTVSAPTLPTGTPIRLRLTMAGNVTTPPDVLLANGVAVFTLTVPQGKGTLQALADLNTQSN